MCESSSFDNLALTKQGAHKSYITEDHFKLGARKLDVDAKEVNLIIKRTRFGSVLHTLYSVIMSCSEVVIVAIRKGHLLGLNNLLLHLGELVSVDLNFTWGEKRSLNQSKVLVIDHATEKPDEWLFELVVALGTNVVVLQVLFTVEGNLLGLHLSVTDINLIANKNNRDGLADTGQILVPFGHVGIGDAGADIEHDDAAVATNVITITETTKFFLASSIPNIENDLTVAREERHGVHFDTESGDIALFELACQVTLDEGGLADATVANEHELEFRGRCLSFNHCVIFLNKENEIFVSVIENWVAFVFSVIMRLFTVLKTTQIIDKIAVERLIN